MPDAAVVEEWRGFDSDGHSDGVLDRREASSD